MIKTTFDKFSQEYDKQMGDTGDYTHQNIIDPALFETIGDIKGKTIYDIGCGNGYIARKFVKLGAKEVWASDISSSLIEIAKTKYPINGIKYKVCDGIDFSNIPVNYFDLITINMAIHYISNLDKLFDNISNSLKVGGRFVFTTDHPLHGLSYLDIGNITTLDEVLKDAKDYSNETIKISENYWDEGKRIKLFKRPFSLYIGLLAEHKLLTYKLIEPPTKRMFNGVPQYSPIPYKFALGAIKI